MVATPLATPRAPLDSQTPPEPSYRELSAILDAALDAVPSAAFVLTPAGALHQSNAAGRRWLEREPTRLRALCAAVRGRAPAEFLVTRVPGGGGALLLVHRDLTARVGERPDAAADAWRFTAREREIFACLLEGRSNRAIAAALAIAERTVEAHLTSMFEKAAVESRAALVARACRP